MASENRFGESQTDVKVTQGESFVIELPGSPGATGAGWQCDASGKRIELVEQGFTPDSDRWGAGGMQRFAFRAQEPGVETLTFEYGRPWEPTPDRSHQVVVTVKSPA